jgi:hypothetical protein
MCQSSIEKPVVVIAENDSKATFCAKCYKKERKKGHKEICQLINCDGSCEWKDCPLKKKVLSDVITKARAPPSVQNKIKEALKSGISQTEFERVFMELVKEPLEEKERTFLERQSEKKRKQDGSPVGNIPKKARIDEDDSEEFNYQDCLDALDTDSDLLFEQESHIKEIRVKVDQIVSIVTEMSTILSKLVKKACNKGVKRKNKH